MLLGSDDLIYKAQRYRKIFGGGMRQAGYLAAAADYALDHNLERLKEDHKNARLFADIVNESEGFSVDTSMLHTNIVMIDIKGERDVNTLTEALYEKGLSLFSISPGRLRAVFHLHITKNDAIKAAEIFKTI